MPQKGRLAHLDETYTIRLELFRQNDTWIYYHRLMSGNDTVFLVCVVASNQVLDVTFLHRQTYIILEILSSSPLRLHHN